MTDLKTKAQNSMDEARTLILGAQILLGVLTRAVFEPGYKKLSDVSKYLVVVALALIAVAVTVLIMPAPYHHIAEEGRDTERFNNFVRKVMYAGLVPFALSFGIALYVATQIVADSWIAPMAGALTAALALFFWYGMGFVRPAAGARSR
jgi:fucose permease